MFYKAKAKETGNMWDTWLYLHEETFYLYYLAKSGDKWDNISMATSSDGVHWQEIGRVLFKGKDVVWMGTGSTWKSPSFDQDGKFIMNFSEWKGPRQTIFFAESTDLVNWTRLSDEYEFKQDERWYQPNGRWDCIWAIQRPDGGLYGYWTATPKPETGGCFGFGETLDGVRWKALAPPEVHGVGEGEVGAIEKIGDKYYMMFGTGGLMVTLVADKPEGPFHAVKKNFHLLSGHTYFSRFFPMPDDLLVNHHSIARDGEVYCAPLKPAVVDSDGTLRLGWWKGNEKMKQEAVDVKLSASQIPVNPATSNPPIIMLEDTFDTDQGVILEGILPLPKSQDSPRSGLYIECGKEQGTAILLDSDGVAELGPMQSDGSGFVCEKQVNREMSLGGASNFRLLLEHSLLEFYLNDILIECFSMPDNATGRIGFIQDSVREPVRDLRVWR